MPKTSSTSCEQAVLVDQTSGVGLPSDAVAVGLMSSSSPTHTSIHSSSRIREPERSRQVGVPGSDLLPNPAVHESRAPATDGLDPLLVRRLATTDTPDRRGIPPSSARSLAWCGRGAAALPRPSGQEALRARRLPARRWPAPRRDRCLVVTPVARPASAGRPSPSRRASCHRARITVKGRACGASPMSLRATP